MNLLRNTTKLTILELYKLRRQRLARIVVLAPALLAALVPQGLWLSSPAEMQGYLAFTTSLQLSLLAGCLLVLFHSAQAVSRERSDRTLREMLAGPVPRLAVILSRWASLLVELLVLVAAVTAAAALSTLSRYTFEDIRGEAIQPLFYAVEVRGYTIRAILGILPAGAALVTLGLFLSVFSASPSVAAALSLGGLVGLDIAKSVFSSSSKLTSWLFNGYLPTLFDQSSYLHGTAALAAGIGDVLWIDGSPRYHLQFVVPAIWTAGLLLLACILFCRKDFPE